MEKKMFLFVISASIFIFSCTSGGNRTANATAGSADTTVGTGDSTIGSGEDSFCNFIPKDSANKMINSYLGSINYPSNDSDLYSMIVDVPKLNAYLNVMTTTGLKATKIKLMFAHTLDYINSGGQNRNCGYKSGKLTLVIAAYDSAGNYIYMNGNRVLEHLQPCPTICPSSGTASNNTLQ
ncbi:MAG: hypothetical protein JSS82_00655 [Bacteroidetes bacterium]|nr:hypothetical protein [Bacteroidota bacterium]